MMPAGTSVSYSRVVMHQGTLQLLAILLGEPRVR